MINLDEMMENVSWVNFKQLQVLTDLRIMRLQYGVRPTELGDFFFPKHFSFQTLTYIFHFSLHSLPSYRTPNNDIHPTFRISFPPNDNSIETLESMPAVNHSLHCVDIFSDYPGGYCDHYSDCLCNLEPFYEHYTGSPPPAPAAVAAATKPFRDQLLSFDTTLTTTITTSCRITNSQDIQRGSLRADNHQLSNEIRYGLLLPILHDCQQLASGHCSENCRDVHLTAYSQPQHPPTDSTVVSSATVPPSSPRLLTLPDPSYPQLIPPR